jgi:hypothetical protein
MPRKAIGDIIFAKVYPMYIAKVERKGRSKADVDAVIFWLTGFDADGVAGQIAGETTFAQFFAQAPAINPRASQIKGLICGIRVEEIADPVEQQVRWLDKLVDELAKGKAMEKVLR